jgi:hypothetical protein
VFGTLPDDTWLYPGHGDDSTLGTERPKIPEWRARGSSAGSAQLIDDDRTTVPRLGDHVAAAI